MHVCTFNLTLFGFLFLSFKAGFFIFLSYSPPSLEAIHVSVYGCVVLYVYILAKLSKKKKKKKKHFQVRETHTHVISHMGRIAAHGHESFLSKS